MRVIDKAKQAALSQLLLDEITRTGPGETLDEKLASKLAAVNFAYDGVQGSYFSCQSMQYVHLTGCNKFLHQARTILRGGITPNIPMVLSQLQR